MYYKPINRKSSAISALLDESPVYQKQGEVNARPANTGEAITTELKSGTTETTNTAKPGDWIVTNPSGEQYIISGEKFFNRYQPTSKTGVYAAKGFCRAVQNPFGEPIQIMASWGEVQVGDEHCFIADVCNAAGVRDGEPYLIDADAFRDTYQKAH